MRRTRCKTCGSGDVAWHQSVAGKWQMFDTTPTVFVPDAGGLALTRDGWVRADSAWTEPPEMLPPHRCPQWSGRRDPLSVADVLEDFITEIPRRRLRLVRPGETA